MSTSHFENLAKLLRQRMGERAFVSLQITPLCLPMGISWKARWHDSREWREVQTPTLRSLLVVVLKQHPEVLPTVRVQMDKPVKNRRQEYYKR
jgi:hypothetical protein